MKRALVAILAVVALAAIAMATSGAHFFKADASVADSGQLAIAIDEAGVGQQTVNYTLSCSSVTYDWGCINGGGNHPQATNKDTQQTAVQGGASFTPENGRVTGTINAPTSPPTPPNNFSCPSGQTLVLADASYSGCVLTDTTNNVSIDQADMTGSFSRIFFTFKK